MKGSPLTIRWKCKWTLKQLKISKATYVKGGPILCVCLKSFSLKYICLIQCDAMLVFKAKYRKRIGLDITQTCIGGEWLFFRNENPIFCDILQYLASMMYVFYFINESFSGEWSPSIIIFGSGFGLGSKCLLNFERQGTLC